VRRSGRRRTDKNGVEVIERPVGAGSVLHVLPGAGIDPRGNQSNVGRPLKIVETGRAVAEVF
jgi:hypothetical protein